MTENYALYEANGSFLGVVSGDEVKVKMLCDDCGVGTRYEPITKEELAEIRNTRRNGVEDKFD